MRAPRRAARRLCRAAVHARPARAGLRDPRTCTNRFMAFAIPFVWIADPDKQRRGVDRSRHAAAHSDRSVDPRVKNYHWLDFVLGLFEAYEPAAKRWC